MQKRDFIDICDYSAEEVKGLLQEAFAVKADRAAYSNALKGKALAMIFEKPSLRTRVTFDVGIHELGGFSVYLSPAEINLGKRESAPDVARNLERMVHAIMVRTFSHRIALDLARFASIPIINGLTDFSHPCQAMADYMTMFEVKKNLQGLKVAFVGDGNNVVHSLIHGGARLGVHLAIGTPEGYEPDAAVVDWARANSPTTGARLELTRDPVEAVSHADVVYTDVWTSMGQEATAAVRRRVFHPYQVNQALLARAPVHAVVTHCLPAHRGEEITDDVLDGPRSVAFDEAENRLHTQKALLAEVL